MIEGKKSLPKAPPLFPKRICLLSAKYKAPEGGSVAQLGVFWAEDAKDWGFFAHFKARLMAQGRFVPRHHVNPPSSVP